MSAIQSTLPFAYNCRFASGIARSASATSTLQVQSDSDFEVQKLTCMVATSTDIVTGYIDILEGRHYPGLSVLITDQGNGRKWSDVAIPIPNLFGTGLTPFQMTQTKVLAKNTVLTFDVTNIYTAQDFVFINFTLWGRKLFT